MLLDFRQPVAGHSIQETGATSSVRPPARMLRMLGEIQLEPWQCLAEFIDNSIDAFFGVDEEWEEIYSKELGSEHHIHIDFPSSNAIKKGHGELKIEDRGPGMALEDVANSATAGFTGNNPIDRLGLFGMGFNIASTRLGDRTTILSTKKGSKFWEGVRIDFDELGNDYNVPNVKQKKVDVNDHGTKVIIEKLKKEINSKMVTPAHLTKMRKKLGRLYSSIIDEKNIRIFFHTASTDNDVKSIKHCVWDEKRYVTRKREKIPAVININQNLGKQFFNTSSWLWSASEQEAIDSAPEGKVIVKDRIVRGWVGIQRFFDKKRYGIDFIRNGRIIEELNKDVFYFKNPDDEEVKEYPLTTSFWGGRIVGEIHCDFLRLSDYKKDSFERYNKQWTDVIGLIRDVQPLRPQIAKKWGYDGKNNSPIGKLHRGYNHGKPVVDNLITKNINNLESYKAKEWVTNFLNGDKDYQNDSKWYAEVEAFEESLRTTSKDDGDDVGGGDLEDPFDDVDETRKEKVELKPNSELSMRYKITESTVSPIEVEVYVNESSTRKEAGANSPMDIDMVKNKAIATYHSKHPDFVDFAEEPMDHLLLELASIFFHKIGNPDEWSLTKCYSELRRTYRKDTLMDLESLSIRAREILNEVRSGIIDSGVKTSKKDLNEDDLNRIRSYVQRQYGLGDEKVNELIKSGMYVNTLPFRYLENLLWDKIPDIMDGVVFNASYKDLGADELKEKAITNVVSCIRDLIDLEERTRIASVESGRKERILLSKAALSLDYLELLMN